MMTRVKPFAHRVVGRLFQKWKVPKTWVLACPVGRRFPKPHSKLHLLHIVTSQKIEKWYITIWVGFHFCIFFQVTICTSVHPYILWEKIGETRSAVQRKPTASPIPIPSALLHTGHLAAVFVCAACCRSRRAQARQMTWPHCGVQMTSGSPQAILWWHHVTPEKDGENKHIQYILHTTYIYIHNRLHI